MRSEAPCMCDQSISLACQLQRAIERAERAEQALAEAKQELLRLTSPGSMREPQRGTIADVAAVNLTSSLSSVGDGGIEHVAAPPSASSVPVVSNRDDLHTCADFQSRHAAVMTPEQCGGDAVGRVARPMCASRLGSYGGDS